MEKIFHFSQRVEKRAPRNLQKGPFPVHEPRIRDTCVLVPHEAASFGEVPPGAFGGGGDHMLNAEHSGKGIERIEYA